MSANRVMSKLVLHASVITLLVSASGCSSLQLSGVGAAWLQNECHKIADLQERQRCLANAAAVHEEHRRRVEGVERRP